MTHPWKRPRRPRADSHRDSPSTVIGERIDLEVSDDTEHFAQCSCGEWVDMRDVKEALQHYGPGHDLVKSVRIMEQPKH